MRAYTVNEIDDLRAVVKDKYLWGSYRGPEPRRGGNSSRSYKEDEMVKSIEEMVRTHMTAGHTADDLLTSEPARERQDR